MKHLAIFTKGVGEKILSGEKIIESRFKIKKEQELPSIIFQ